MNANITNGISGVPATSARGAMRVGVLATLVVLGGAASTPTTSSSADQAFKKERERAWRATTTSGGGCSDSPASYAKADATSVGGAAINEVRQRSGLTWEQLSRLFQVSRRSLHFWASGKPLTPINEEKLHRVLAVIQHIDRGSAADTRTTLLQAGRGGLSAYHLLIDNRYDEAIMLAGPGTHQLARRPPSIDEPARLTRRPPKIADQLSMLDELIHTDSGKPKHPRPTRRKS